MSFSALSAGSPAAITETSKLVPPMSQATRLRCPAFPAPRRFVERRQDPASGIDPLGHLGPQVARDQRLEAPGHAIRIGASATAELENVAKPGCGNQPAARSLAFEHGIGGDCGAVDQ